MKRTLIFLYGAGSYMVFMATFLYAIGFIGGFAVPKPLDGHPRVSLMPALLIDTGLLLVSLCSTASWPDRRSSA